MTSGLASFSGPAGSMAGPDVQVIFLTATVSPKMGTLDLVRSDSALRLQDYLDAFRFYADVVRRNPDYRLLLVENSGTDLAEFERIAADAGIAERTECISYAAEENPALNRLYLEGGLIREAVKRSRYISLPGAGIWKVTGRYLITNIEALIRKRPKVFDIYVNLRDYPSRVVDFYFAGFSRKGLEAVIARIWDRLQVTSPGELILRQAIDTNLFADLDLVKRLNVVPFIKGRRGHDNRQYDGVTQIAKYWVRVAMNAVAPRIWI